MMSVVVTRSAAPNRSLLLSDIVRRQWCCYYESSYGGSRRATVNMKRAVPFTTSTTSSTNPLITQQQTRSKYDPTAKRPNKVCDPYGQGGKPMSWSEAKMLVGTVNDQWKLQGDENELPLLLTREFVHPDYLSGARLIQKLAAVAQINNHFPVQLALQRRIVRKNWQVVSSVQCQTLVLGGLSRHDFHLAMMIDVEVSRPENLALLFDKE